MARVEIAPDGTRRIIRDADDIRGRVFDIKIEGNPAFSEILKIDKFHLDQMHIVSHAIQVGRHGFGDDLKLTHISSIGYYPSNTKEVYVHTYDNRFCRMDDDEIEEDERVNIAHYRKILDLTEVFNDEIELQNELCFLLVRVRHEIDYIAHRLEREKLDRRVYLNVPKRDLSSVHDKFEEFGLVIRSRKSLRKLLHKHGAIWTKETGWYIADLNDNNIILVDIFGDHDPFTDDKED